MRKEITVTAEARSTRGKNEARRLRVKGLSPAVLYGSDRDAVAVSVNPKDVNKILHSNTGHNTIFNLAVQGGEATPVMIVDWQSDPVKDTLLHVDLKRIDLAKRNAFKVRVHTTGEPKGVKLQGGLLEVITREIEIECLPGRHSGVVYGGRDGIDDRPKLARRRHSAGRIGDVAEPARAGDRARGRAEGRGCGNSCRGSRCCNTSRAGSDQEG